MYKKGSISRAYDFARICTLCKILVTNGFIDTECNQYWTGYTIDNVYYPGQAAKWKLNDTALKLLEDLETGKPAVGKSLLSDAFLSQFCDKICPEGATMLPGGTGLSDLDFFYSVILSRIDDDGEL